MLKSARLAKSLPPAREDAPPRFQWSHGEGAPAVEPGVVLGDSPWEAQKWNQKTKFAFSCCCEVSIVEVAAYTHSKRSIETREFAGTSKWASRFLVQL